MTALLAHETSTSRIEARLAGEANVGLKHSFLGRVARAWRRSPIWTKVATWLRQAGWSDPDRTVVSITLLAAGLFLLGVLAFASAVKAAAITILGFCSFLVWASQRSKARAELFAHQLPGLIRSISAGLAAGLSLPQALDNSASEAESPAREEIRTISEQMALGLPFDDALEGLRARVPLEELDTILVGLAIQRRSGGNLVELLQGIGQSISEKRRIQANLRVETAQARMSAGVIGAMPVLVAVGISIVDPSFIAPLFSTTAGAFMTATAAIFEVLGFFILRRILEIDA